MIWILNGLYHRPEPRFQKLAEEACQQVPLDYEDYDEDLDDSDNDSMPLMYDAGLYFVCDIVVDHSGTYRLPFHKTFTEEAIIAAFRITIREIKEVMGVGDLHLSRPKAHLERTANRSKRRTIHVDDIRPEDRDLPQIDSHLDNIQLRPTQRMRGEDVNHFAIHGGGNRTNGVDDHNDEESQDITLRVKKILEQFFFDMIEESPNKKSAKEGAWTNIPRQMRAQEATEQLFQSFALPFFAAQYCFCTTEQWDMHFNRLFPLQFPTSSGQNFRKCTYYTQWLNLISALNQQSLRRVRATIKTKFDSLAWIPYTQSDRMWSTRPCTGVRVWSMLPQGQPYAGPQIALNPRSRHLGLGKPFLRATPNPAMLQQDDSDEAEELQVEEDEGLAHTFLLQTAIRLNFYFSAATGRGRGARNGRSI